MIAEVNPGLILIVGAGLLPLLPHIVRGPAALLLGVATLMHMLSLNLGDAGVFTLFGYELVTLRVDKLSLIFGLIFAIAGLAATLYTLHVRGWLELTAALMYAGSAIGAIFAGDLITLFVFWEITAITSVFLIWGRGTERAFDTGMRYLIVQVGSGVILLAGVLLLVHETGSSRFGVIADIDVAALASTPLYAWLILIGFGIKAAFPLLNNWLQDSYPEATPTGTVWLSIFTTKLAIYALARGFPGSDLLIVIGSIMAIVPIVFAVIEDDLRRVLAYALNNQLGFMVVGVGIGSELALNGVAAHAVCHILYKALLFMSMGAVLTKTGTARASELGGLSRAMPVTATFCIVGALAMSTPLFAGFVSKAFLVSSAVKDGAFVAWLALMAGSAGVFLVAGLKVTYDAFYAPPSDARRLAAADDDQGPEAPWNMIAAMGLVAALAVFIGVAPSISLYPRLPFIVTYEPYTIGHVVTQVQLLLATALVFATAVTWRFWPARRTDTVLDTDWLYRRVGYPLTASLLILARDAWQAIIALSSRAAEVAERNISRAHNPNGVLGRTWPTGLMAFWAIAMLAGFLVLLYAA
ncbi:MAG: Na(+)/H(+) antiporter subunit D [Hyphomicrobiaceae bacterium]